MKTPGFITACLLLCCLACNQSSLVDQVDASLPDKQDHVNSLTDLLFALHDSCVSFETTYWLNASGTHEIIRSTASEEGPCFRGLAGTRYQVGTYTIEATGDAISDIYARGRTEMQLILHEVSHAMTAEMTTLFYYGEELELTVDGVAEIGSDSLSTQIRVAIDSARLYVGETILELDHGEIIFDLPLIPEGAFIIQASTVMRLCTQ